MTEKELLKTITNLKSVNPSAQWLKSNREILLAQVGNSANGQVSPWRNFIVDLKSLARTASQPAFALGSFLVILLSISLFGHQAFSRVQPTDSLYIARIISEKARLNTILNEADRDQLALRFATDRARDISATLADPNFNSEGQEEKVAKLNNDFNQEIATVKTVISRIKPVVSVSVEAPLDDLVISADSLKDDNGIEVLEKDMPVSGQTTNSQATSSEDVVVEVVIKKDTEAIIDEAKKMFDNKEYSQALDKLHEVEELIKNK